MNKIRSTQDRGSEKFQVSYKANTLALREDKTHCQLLEEIIEFSDKNIDFANKNSITNGKSFFMKMAISVFTSWF